MKQPESIILAFSNVMNDNLKYLNPELQKIRNVLKDAEEKNLLTVIEHNGVTYNSLFFLLNSSKGKEVTMLHFSGHSSKNGLMVQSHDESGVVSKKPLSNLIKSHKKFRFIFLNSCYSRQIAQDLINAGVPYVIGTSDRVKDEAAAIVSAKFYSLIAKSGKTIEEAFLLTKDYMEDPLNDDDDKNIKEAFRTFTLVDENENEYPWQLFQSPGLKEKDKNWVLNPRQPRKKLTVLLGIISLSAVLLYFGISNLNGNKIKTDTLQSDTTIITDSARFHKDAPVTKLQPDNNNNQRLKLPVDTQKQVSKTLRKKIFASLKIVNSDNQYDNDITVKVREIFSQKEYQLEEAGVDLPPENYDNVISGQLILSSPVKTEGAFNLVKVEYTVQLILRFINGARLQICGQKYYSAKVSTNEKDTKERVLQQGLSDILDKLQADSSFPFCIKK